MIKKQFTCLIVSYIFLSGLSGCRSNNYRIYGTADTEFDGATAVLRSFNDMDSLIYSDTVQINDGKFYFEGKELLEGISDVRVRKDSKILYSRLFLERGNIYLELGESEKYNNIHGTPLNEIYQTHQDSMTYYFNEIDRLDTTRTAHSVSFTLGTELADAWNNYGAYFIRFKRNNINNIVGRSEFLRGSVVNIPESFYMSMNKLSFLEAYDFLDSSLLNHPKVVEYLEAERKREEERNRPKLAGTQYTDFELSTTGGEKKRLSDYIGKHEFVYLDFWASWCGPCIADIPHLKEVYEKYHNKGLEIIGITLDESQEDWTKAIREHALPWPQLWGPESISEIQKVYRFGGIPYGVLIDKNGKIISTGPPHSLTLDIHLNDLDK